MDIFENINIANLSINRYEEYFGGVKCKLYYAPVSYFFYTPFPNPSETFSSEIEIKEEILIKSNRNLSCVDILIDEAELKAIYQGSIRRKKGTINLSVYLLGFHTEILGFAERLINIPMIFFIEDSNGTNWQIGTKRNWAHIENFDASTGKKYEDNPGATLIINCNSTLFKYNFPLDDISVPGDFNYDYNNDFFKVNYEQ